MNHGPHPFSLTSATSTFSPKPICLLSFLPTTTIKKIFKIKNHAKCWSKPLVKHTNKDNAVPSSPANPDATTYTTIPIPGADVILRSFQNISSFISLRRPWPGVIAGTGSFDRPGSLSAAGTRLEPNSKYFLVNYAILISICTALSLLGSPGALIVFAFVFTLWLVLYFFREDPMVV